MPNVRYFVVDLSLLSYCTWQNCTVILFQWQLVRPSRRNRFTICLYTTMVLRNFQAGSLCYTNYLAQLSDNIINRIKYFCYNYIQFIIMYPSRYALSILFIFAITFIINFKKSHSSCNLNIFAYINVF